jgi:hypothetical protein
MFKFSDGQIKFAGYPAEDIAEGDSQSLKEYVKTTSKELRRGALEPAQIQRRMYWFLTKILEYGLFPSGPTFARVMAFYQASVIELDEK